MNKSATLRTRALGNTGLAPSIAGLGTVKLGRNAGVKYPGGAVIPTDAEARSLLDCAESLGITLLDTAPAYGNSEERLGSLLRGRRHPWLIVTKAGEEWDGGASNFDFSEDAIARSINRSLTRLGTDCVACVLLHSDGIAESAPGGFSGAVKALESAKRAGKARSIGASVKSAVGARAAIAWAGVLMLEFGADPAMESVAAEAAQRGVGILVKKALASGHLDRLGANPIRGAMKRALGYPGVGSVVIGTTNIGHLRENCEALACAADELDRNLP